MRQKSSFMRAYRLPPLPESVGLHVLPGRDVYTDCERKKQRRPAA